MPAFSGAPPCHRTPSVKDALARIPRVDFVVERTTDPHVARVIVLRSIDAGSPVLVSTNHARTSGHIILVIGYEPMSRRDGREFICHDPYGKFDPEVGSRLFGQRRFEGGMSTSDGQHGPGEGVRRRDMSSTRSWPPRR